MPGQLTEITEIATALGTLEADLPAALACRPDRLRNVDPAVWGRVVDAWGGGGHERAFTTAFANGRAFLDADDGLRGRPPRTVEWKGPHRPPGDDVIPADLRVDHVYAVSCKYLSRILLNAGPVRLFDRLLVGEDRAGGDWFAVTAPAEYAAFYELVRIWVGRPLPPCATDLTREQRRVMRDALRARQLPPMLRPSWRALVASVSARSAERWRERLRDPRTRLRLLWRLLRIGDAPYFVLGTDGAASLRLRVASSWDWLQAFELRALEVAPRSAGQPEVGWRAVIRDRATGRTVEVDGHVEVRWSHGRFSGAPEAKVYLDTPHERVPGYWPLV